MTLTDVWDRCDEMEECYEFMLAYAAQGLPTDAGSQTGGQVRGYLERARKAVDGLADACRAAAGERGLEPADKYRAFFIVLERDAADSLAAIELALAQRVIGSQLVDNLNASTHLRALLTDLFFVGDIFRAIDPESVSKAD